VARSQQKLKEVTKKLEEQAQKGLIFQREENQLSGVVR
jgi:hypothetical protein